MAGMKLWGIFTSAIAAAFRKPRCEECGMKLGLRGPDNIGCVNDWCPQLPFQIFTNRRTGTKPMGR